MVEVAYGKYMPRQRPSNYFGVFAKGVPSRTRLQERCVPCPLEYPLCENCNEDEWHILFNCNDSIQARQAAGLEQFIGTRIHQFSTVKDLILDIFRKENKEIAGRCAVLICTVRNNRNSFVWNASKENGRILGAKTHHFWIEWWSVQNIQRHGTCSTIEGESLVLLEAMKEMEHRGITH
ncbi:putative reverse transcriptase, partial [Trifolium medium]|nr:putative reverse transcriptase [Trifolium medium]